MKEKQETHHVGPRCGRTKQPRQRTSQDICANEEQGDCHQRELHVECVLRRRARAGVRSVFFRFRIKVHLESDPCTTARLVSIEVRLIKIKFRSRNLDDPERHIPLDFQSEKCCIRRCHHKTSAPKKTSLP